MNNLCILDLDKFLYQYLQPFSLFIDLVLILWLTAELVMSLQILKHPLSFSFNLKGEMDVDEVIDEKT